MQKTGCETSRGSLSNIPFDKRLMVFQPPSPPLCCSGAWSPNSMYRLCHGNCHLSYTGGNDSDLLGLVFSHSKWDDQRSPSVISLFSLWSFVGVSYKAAFSNQIEKTFELNKSPTHMLQSINAYPADEELCQYSPYAVPYFQTLFKHVGNLLLKFLSGAQV